MFVWLAVPLPVNAEIQCEVIREFPVVLEVGAHLALEIPVPVVPDFRRSSDYRVLRALYTERLVDVGD